MLKKAGIRRWNTESFLGNKTVLFDTVMVDTRDYTFVKTHRMYSKKVNPNVNYGLELTLIYQYSSSV